MIRTRLPLVRAPAADWRLGTRQHAANLLEVGERLNCAARRGGAVDRDWTKCRRGRGDIHIGAREEAVVPQPPQVQNARGAVVGAPLRELQQAQVAAELIQR